MAMTDMTIVARSLSLRRFSTATTVLMVAVAVALLLTLLSLRDAARKSFERGPGTMHLLVTADTGPLPSVLNAIFYARAPARPITWARYLSLTDATPDNPRRLPLDFAVPVQQGDNYQGWPTLATTREFFDRFQPDPDAERDPSRRWALAAGRLFEKPFEVVVGAKAAAGAGLRVGETIYLTHGTGASRSGAGGTDDHGHVHREYGFTVVGILAPTGSAHDRALFTDLIGSWILHAHDRRERQGAKGLTTEADLTDADRLITGIYMRVRTRPGSDASSAIGPVIEMIRRQGDLTVANPADQIRQLFVIVSNVDQVFVAMSVIVLICSGLAITLAMVNSMESRRRQIAVLRVLGAGRGRIFSLVVTEAAIIGAIGAAAGIVLAFMGVQIAGAVLKARLGLLLDATIPLDALLPVAAGTIILAALAGLAPGVSAYRTSVARNLRPLG